MARCMVGGLLCRRPAERLALTVLEQGAETVSCPLVSIVDAVAISA